MAVLSENAKAAVDIAVKSAARSGGIVCTEHLLFGLVSTGRSAQILKCVGLTKRTFDTRLFAIDGRLFDKVEMSARAVSAVTNARLLADKVALPEAGTEFLLYTLLDDPASVAYGYLEDAFGVDVSKFRRTLLAEITSVVPSPGSGRSVDAGLSRIREAVTASTETVEGKTKRGTKAEASGADELDRFGFDLTAKAEQGKLDPVIGRKSETERVVQILCRRTKNNPVLIGEPGVGKSAVVEGLAQAIVSGDVPENLKGMRVFSLDVASVVAGTRYRGDFEERLKKALDIVRASGNIILFIDEVHTILRCGDGGGGLDVANIIKPLLARGELRTIGATTFEEYRKYFEKDAALERRFQPVTVGEPSVSDTIEILQGLKPRYEKHHGVEITDEALSAAAIFSDRYISDRFLPDKAVDLIDEASSRKRIRAGAGEPLRVAGADVAELVAEITGIPVGKITEGEGERLKELDAVLGARVIGQPSAVSAVAKAIKRARLGLKDPGRPIGSFVFTGPTGVGKTELAKALAEALFGDEDLLVRLDMSEYMDKQNVSKLIGSAPGLVGFEEGGQLTEKVRRKPYSVVLFDEIEKADPEIFNILLQILDDGRLTDAHGRTVSFKNTLVILTTNLGVGVTASRGRIGFAKDTAPGGENEETKTRQIEALKAAMKPELVNRIDEIVVFNSLGADSIGEIADLMLKKTAMQLKELDLNVTIDDAAKALIVASGTDEEYGARPLRRTIQRLLLDKIGEMLLSGEISSGDTLSVTASEGRLIIRAAA